MGLPGAACVLTGAGGCALDFDGIESALECGTLLLFDDDDGIDITLDVFIDLGGGAAAGSVPPRPLPAMPPV